jgi:hypothetical protein
VLLQDIHQTQVNSRFACVGGFYPLIWLQIVTQKKSPDRGLFKDMLDFMDRSPNSILSSSPIIVLFSAQSPAVWDHVSLADRDAVRAEAFQNDVLHRGLLIGSADFQLRPGVVG